MFVPSLTVDRLGSMCGSVLSSGIQSPALRRVLVYGMLYNLCIEYSGFYTSTPRTGHYSQLAAYFIGELEHALLNVPLALPANQETVEALLVGVSMLSHRQIYEPDIHLIGIVRD